MDEPAVSQSSGPSGYKHIPAVGWGMVFTYFFRSLGGLAFRVVAVILVGSGAIFVGSSLTTRALAGAAGLILTLLIFLGRARSAVVATFCQAYANTRGLSWQPGDSLPERTPLLRLGEDHSTTNLMMGRLPGGANGALAHYSYAVGSHGNKAIHNFTVVLADVPECAGFVDQLYCERKIARTETVAWDAKKSLVGTNLRPVELESVAADRRFDIFTPVREDENRVRQIFSPTFVDWLATKAPADFAFELVEGTLCASLTKTRLTDEELDALCEGASVVVTRLREEATE